MVNVSTLGASIQRLPESYHLAQLYPYRSSKVNPLWLAASMAKALGLTVVLSHTWTSQSDQTTGEY